MLFWLYSRHPFVNRGRFISIFVVSKLSIVICGVHFISSLLRNLCGQNIRMMFEDVLFGRLNVVPNLFQSPASILGHIAEWTEHNYDITSALFF